MWQRDAHALVGTFGSVSLFFIIALLEEEAVAAYTEYLKAIDAGDFPNGPAPEIAKR